MVQRMSSAPCSEELALVMRRRIEEDGRDHQALSVAKEEMKPCSAAATEVGILYWQCSLPAYSSLQPYSPTVAFAVLVDNPLENAISRFYAAHETDHMRRHVPISKYFKAQARGRFSEEHLQHIRAFVVGGREFLKSSEKYRQYHDLGNSQFRKIANEPHKALDVVRALRMAVAPSSAFSSFLVMLRRRMAWPLRQIIHTPVAPPNQPTSSDWPPIYVEALNNTPKVRADWVFYEGAMQIAADQRLAFGAEKFDLQVEEFEALQGELVRKCDEPSSGAVLRCMLELFDRCVVPEGRKGTGLRKCGALLLAIGDGDSSFSSLT